MALLNARRRTENPAGLFYAKLDFALSEGCIDDDGSKAVSYFGDDHRHRESNRFITAFSTQAGTDDNDTLISFQRRIWLDLICEVWIAGEGFWEALGLTDAEREYVSASSSNMNQRLDKECLEHSAFPLVIRSPSEIRLKIEKALGWQKVHATT